MDTSTYILITLIIIGVIITVGLNLIIKWLIAIYEELTTSEKERALREDPELAIEIKRARLSKKD